MTFTVTWVPDAERELAERWLGSPDREAITLAADQIELQLRYRPEEVGESRPAGRRILIVPPLAVTYRVRTEDRIVQVLNVRELS